MSAVRIRVYTDQFEGICVEVDGRPVVPGETISGMIDNVDVEQFVRRVLRALVQTVPLDNIEVTD